MKVIPVCNLNNNVLTEIFKENQLEPEIVVVYPADAQFDLEEDSYVKVLFPENKEVILWVSPKDGLLRMRSILLSPKELSKLDSLKIDLDKKIAYVNQNAGAFGSLNINAVGLVIDYALPYGSGILDETILLAGENLARGAKIAWRSIERIVNKALAKNQ